MHPNMKIKHITSHDTDILNTYIYVPEINLNLVALSSMDGLKIKSNRRNFRCLPHPTLQGVSSITV